MNAAQEYLAEDVSAHHNWNILCITENCIDGIPELEENDIEEIDDWMEEELMNGKWLGKMYTHNFSKRGHEHTRFQIIQTIEFIYNVELAHQEVVECNSNLLKASKEQWDNNPEYWMQKPTDPEDLQPLEESD